MDKDKIIKLEDFIFQMEKKPLFAAGVMADIVGVLIDLKPAMLGFFAENELKNFKIEDFDKLLNDLGLKRVYFEKHNYLNGKNLTKKGFCISKKTRLAKQTHKAFFKLWSTMDDRGEILDQRKWTKVTKKIGRLLGYPKTAIDEFTKERDIDNKNRIERMNRNRYYAHSAKYENDEFRSYDQKLNRALADFAPKTAALFSKDTEKRWLV
jgi:hypothetical protein